MLPAAEQVTALFDRRWRSTVGLVTLRRHMIPQNDLGEVKGRVQVPCRERQVDRQPLDDAFAKFHAWYSIIQPKAPLFIGGQARAMAGEEVGCGGGHQALRLRLAGFNLNLCWTSEIPHTPLPSFTHLAWGVADNSFQAAPSGIAPDIPPVPNYVDTELKRRE
jgi:hypothetical protein